MPDVLSNRGSRTTRLLSGITSRRRDTAFLEESSCGACFDVREKSRVSFLPAFRSRDSLFDQPSSLIVLGLRDLVVEVEDKLDCAFANAPKDMDDVGREGFSSSSSSDEDCELSCVSVSFSDGSCGLKGEITSLSSTA